MHSELEDYWIKCLLSSKQDEIPKDEGHAASLTPNLSFSEHILTNAYSFPLFSHPGLSDEHQVISALPTEIKSSIMDKVVKCTTLRMEVEFIIYFLDSFIS